MTNTILKLFIFSSLAVFTLVGCQMEPITVPGGRSDNGESTLTATDDGQFVQEPSSAARAFGTYLTHIVTH